MVPQSPGQKEEDLKFNLEKKHCFNVQSFLYCIEPFKFYTSLDSGVQHVNLKYNLLNFL